MIDRPIDSGSFEILVSFNHQIAKLQERYLLVTVGGAVRQFKPQRLIKINRQIQIVCRDADMLQPGRNFGKSHVIPPVYCTKVSKYICTI